MPDTLGNRITDDGVQESFIVFMNWIEDGPYDRITKTDCSRWHRLLQAETDKKIYSLFSGDQEVWWHGISTIESPSFVLKHDWANALDGSNLEGEYPFPYDVTGFEMVIGGRPVIAVGVTGPYFAVYVESTDGAWFDIGGRFYLTEENKERMAVMASLRAISPIVKLVEQEVRAVCIALDAEVATHTVVRAPERLNAKRAKAGKTALRDYHVVDLSKRTRIANPSEPQESTGRKVRLHFRRGHWRHFDRSKSWIKWCLAGDPNLGFVDKHYRL